MTSLLRFGFKLPETGAADASRLVSLPTKHRRVNALKTRERIHQLVDELPETELEQVAHLLERRYPSNPLLRALAVAPPDDEPESPEEADAIEQAYADVAAGRVVSHEESLRRLSARA